MAETEKKKHKTRVGSIIAWIFCGLIFIFVAYEIALKLTKNSIYLFGHRSDVVLTDSMSYKNTEDPVCIDFLKEYDNQYQKGDLVFSTKVTETSELNVGDVVLFYHNDSGLLTCHRIVKSYKSSGGLDVYVIRADTAKSSEDDGVYLRERIVSKVTGSIPKIGYVVGFFQSFYGMILFSGLIVIIVVFDSLISKSKEKEEQELLTTTENSSPVIENKPEENSSPETKEETKPEVKKYKCPKCGNIFTSETFPSECPSCHAKLQKTKSKEGDKKAL